MARAIIRGRSPRASSSTDEVIIKDRDPNVSIGPSKEHLVMKSAKT